MRIAVFGATGQIGFALTKKLASQGHDVRVLVRRDRNLFPESVRVGVENEFDVGAMEDVLKGADAAVYAIGLAEQWVADPSVFKRVNSDLFEAFLTAFDRAGTPALMYVSTFEVFSPADGQIRESNPLADPSDFSAYYRSMLAGYQAAVEFADRTGIRLVTLHPAAVYGGRNTGMGLTGFLDNLVQRRYWKVPFIPPTRFPSVHVKSLAEAALCVLGKQGAWIVSDGMTSLREMARILRGLGHGFVPPRVPLCIARAAAHSMEVWAGLTGQPPLMANVQLDFLTAGHEPISEKAQERLDWEPMPLEQGIELFVERRG
ncbi:MAG: NAD-dependent epimerase/dehydratase family protein [Anaerolineales bacterium]|nr:NAD-dependent epimerase/dehydratase family protein [Anaerolineales bacterium]